jgi:hypothetical protein
MQATFLKIFQKLPKQIQSLLALKTKKNNKRKLVSYQNNESDGYIINCVKTYHGKLNKEILAQVSYYSNGRMESIQKIGEQKKWFQGLMQSIKIDSSSSP